MQAGPVIAAVALMGVMALPQPEAFDIVITNGRIIDGTGAPARTGSVGIRAGLVARIGNVAVGRATIVIDARGQVVAPGLIAVLAGEEAVTSMPGVTTVVAGSRGMSAVDIAEHLDQIEATGTAVNYATLLGHNTIRLSIMGRADRPPTVTELQRMKALMFRAMADGAFGLSTDLTDVPGRYAQEPEVVELARVAANEDGVFVTYASGEDVASVEAARQAIKVGTVAGMPVRISRQRAGQAAASGDSGTVAVMIESARRRGLDVDVTADDEGGTLLVGITAAGRAPGVSIEEAIRRVTSRPAHQFGLTGRGELRVGAAADVIVFDPSVPAGVSYVIVNGVVTLRNGVDSRVSVGQVIRHSR